MTLVTDPGSAELMLDMIDAETSAPIYCIEDVFLDTPKWKYGMIQNKRME
jgi:hypothetical protein